MNGVIHKGEKFFSPTIAAGIALAVAFTSSCSDNKDDNNIADSNAENFQVYMEDDCPGTCPFSPFAGNGVIRIGVYDMDGEYKDFKEFIPFGTVKNGKGTLDFSVEIPSVYLAADEKFFAADELYLISGNKAYSLERYYESATKYEYVIYAYATQATVESELNINQGWNAIYAGATRNSVKMSTNPGTVNLGSIKWQASYRGSATFFGGPDDESIDHSAGDYCDIGARCYSIQELSEIYESAVDCDMAFGGGTPVHSCPETIDGYCISTFGSCSPDNDKHCNYFDGSFSIDKPSDCEWDD